MNLVITSVGIINLDMVSRFYKTESGHLIFDITGDDHPVISGDEAKAIWAALVYTAQHPDLAPVTIGPYDPATGKTEHRTYNPPEDDLSAIEQAMETIAGLNDAEWDSLISLPQIEGPLKEALHRHALREAGRSERLVRGVQEATPLTESQWAALNRSVQTNQEEARRILRNVEDARTAPLPTYLSIERGPKRDAAVQKYREDLEAWRQSRGTVSG